MKFHLGSLPEYDNFEPSDQWRAFEDNETSIWQWQIKALPVAVLNIVIILAVWAAITPVWEVFKGISFPLPIVEALSCLFGVLLMHELIHGAIHPGAGFSSRTIVGFWPSRMLLYVTYSGEMNRNRYLAVLAAPLLVICLVPILVSVVLQVQSFWLVYITILNALLASGDILAIHAIRKLPAGAVIRNKGCHAYWRLADD